MPTTDCGAARCRVNTTSSASEISPTVARARLASIERARRLPPPLRAASVSAASAARARAGSRLPRTRSSRAIWAARTAALSTSRISTGSASSERYLLTPTMTSSPRSIARLAPRREFFDAQFRHAALDRARHAAQRLDLVDEGRRRGGDRVGQALDVIAAAERVDDMGDAGFLGEDQLGVASDPGRSRRRQAKRFVEGIGVQRLGAAEHRRPAPRSSCGRCCCAGPAR